MLTSSLLLNGVAKPACRPHSSELALAPRCWTRRSQRPHVSIRRALAASHAAPQDVAEPSSSEAGPQLTNRISQAQNGQEVAVLLRLGAKLGASEGIAAPPLLGAALDRLRALQQQRQQKWLKKASPDIAAAFQLAWHLSLACLPIATPRVLKALARTAHAINFAPPHGNLQLRQQVQQQQRDITDAFIALMRQQLQQLEQEQQRDQQQQDEPAPAAAAAVEAAREIAEFTCAVFGSRAWCRSLAAEQRRELLALVRRSESGRIEDDVALLAALVHLQEFVGEKAVAPLREDGTIALLAERVFSRLGKLKPKTTQEVLLSLGALGHPLQLRQLAALLQHQAARIRGGKRCLENIAKTFKGLELVCREQPEVRAAVLTLPAALELCEKFVGSMGSLEQEGRMEEWASMVRACAELMYDPRLGDGRRLFVVLLTWLPELVKDCSPLDSIDALVGLSAQYGLPMDGVLPMRLVPYRQQLRQMVAKALGYSTAKAKRALEQQDVREVVEAFAALS